uniref:TspO/MBR family protein n=1 Tax=Ascaris lumbricoides TaxID=6252 RepID=A0A9J2P4A8_ASCLU
MGVYSSLLQLDTFSLPLEKVCLDECDRQVLLGRDFIEALVRWAYIFPGKIDMIDTTIIHDVRRIIKRHTKWFILFVGVCVIDRSSPMTLYEIEEGIDLMMMRFGGVDRVYSSMVWTSEDTKKAILATVIPGGAALTAFGAFVNDRDVVDWWTKKAKPSWAPKDVRLYSAIDLLTMSPLGYASYLVYKTGGGLGSFAIAGEGFDYTDTKVALGLYGANITLALATIPLMKKKNLRCLFYNTALLNATAIAASYAFYKIDRTAGLLLIPYALWTGFYAFLTYAIAKDNESPKPGEGIVKVETTSM